LSQESDLEVNLHFPKRQECNGRPGKTINHILPKGSGLLTSKKSPGIIVSESGINDKKALDRVLKVGADAVLIGTSIMLSESIEEKVRKFTGK